MHLWLDFITERDQATIEAARYATRGASTFASRREGDHPALLIIDMQTLFIGDDVPLLDAIRTAPTMIGAVGWRAAEHIVTLLNLFRQGGRPIIHATMQPHNRPATDPLLHIIAPLTPQPDERVIRKRTVSAFYDSDLADDLRRRGCDSVIVCGTSTSGCVRAAAVDAVQAGFGVYVPYDAVCDRIEASHAVSLLDIWMKYGSVVSSSDLLERFAADIDEKSGGEEHHAHRT